MLFLGTGAAEGFPNPFCNCEACLAAKKSADPKLKRRRSALLLNDETMIDFGPDVMFACAAYGASLHKLKHMFLTHSHEDHFSYWNLAYMGMSETWGDRYIAMYMSREARGLIEQFIAFGEHCGHPDVENQLRNTEKHYQFITVEPFRTYRIDDMNVMAVYGRHNGFASGEESLNYYFETQQQGNIFYASDTGRVYDGTYEALKGKRLGMPNAFNAAMNTSTPMRRAITRTHRRGRYSEKSHVSCIPRFRRRLAKFTFAMMVNRPQPLSNSSRAAARISVSH